MNRNLKNIDVKLTILVYSYNHAYRRRRQLLDSDVIRREGAVSTGISTNIFIYALFLQGIIFLLFVMRYKNIKAVIVIVSRKKYEKNGRTTRMVFV